MQKKIQELIDEKDWRLQAVAGLAHDQYIFGELYKADSTILTVAGNVPFKGGTVISFDLPNVSAMYLDSSFNSFEESSKYLIYRNFIKTGLNKQLEPSDYNEFMIFLQKRINSIFFGYSALDSFIDELIKDDAIYFTENNKKLDKQRIQKLKLDVRLWKVLPQLLKIEASDLGIFKKYKEFKVLRDRLIHPKAIDKQSFSKDDDSIWRYLLNKDVQNYAVVVSEIILYFSSYLKDEEKPRWIKKLNFKIK